MAYATQQKMAIQKVLEGSKEPLTPQQILASAREKVPAMGIATVYRYLNALQKEGKISLVEIPNRSPRYVLASEMSKVYLVCAKTDRVIPCSKEVTQLQEIASSEGFDLTGYQVFLFGNSRS